jgi:hypothetical protein
MDILNFISWIKGGRQVTTVDPNKTLLAVGLKDSRRDDGYLSGAITVQDFVNQYGTGPAGPAGPTGLTGLTGQTGAQGVPGANGAVGPAGLNWQGLWVSGTAYVADDAVGYGGASYFCINATSGTTTPDLDTTNWALLAAQGAQGLQGIQGVPGPNISGFKAIGAIPEGSVVTGGTTLTPYISGSILVPANTLATNSVLQTSWGVYRTGFNVVQSQIYVNTSNSLVGATRIATGANQSADGGWLRNERDFQKVGNKIYGYNFLQQITNDITFTSNFRDEVTIDPTVDLYIIFAVLLGDTSEQATINRVRITEHS